ncbi:MAG: ABC transporter ATP-binding protein [Anaerolineae bacterium]|nr:ABC transporter ATP-binding protein [Anaerolineae bacterium]
MKGIRRLLPFLVKYWKTSLGALLSLLIVNAANLYTPQLLRQLIDDGITPKNLNVVLSIAGIMIAVALGRGLFSFFQGYLSEVLSQSLAYDLRNSLYEKLQKLSFSYHDQAQTGKLMTRTTSDVDQVRMFVGNGILQLLSAIILLVGTMVILFSMNATLTGIFLLTLPPIFVVFGFFVTKIMPLSTNVQVKLANLNTVLQENLAGIRIVKAFAREDYEISRFSDHNKELLDVNVSLQRLFSSSFPIIFLIANLGTVAVVWVGGNQVINLQLTLGELVAFLGYQGFFLMPVFMLGMIGAAISRAEASAVRINEVLDAESDVTDKPGAVDVDIRDGAVSFENVSFRYFGGSQDVIHDITFSVKPRQTVAILGKTGSGKSSIINLIPRFYDVSQGVVKIDGMDVRDMTIASLRSHVGIVLQETTLFSGTIQENIAYGKPSARMEDIIEAARTAQAHDFIMEFPDGYGTEIGERGVGLSGGQKQRIAIARALLLDPKILIMDDSTSSVDAETEYKIQQALDKLKKESTTFVIAQRISTVRNADLILLLDNGELAGQGSHEELLACCELYAEILESQFNVREEILTADEEAAQ